MGKDEGMRRTSPPRSGSGAWSEERVNVMERVDGGSDMGVLVGELVVVVETVDDVSRIGVVVGDG